MRKSFKLLGNQSNKLKKSLNENKNLFVFRKYLIVCSCFGYIINNTVFIINVIWFKEFKAEYLLLEVLQVCIGISRLIKGNDRLCKLRIYRSLKSLICLKWRRYLKVIFYLKRWASPIHINRLDMVVELRVQIYIDKFLEFIWYNIYNVKLLNKIAKSILPDGPFWFFD